MSTLEAHTSISYARAMRLNALLMGLGVISGVVFVSVQTAQSAQSRVARDIEELVRIGPRYPGTPGIERARAYLSAEYRKAGYVIEEQSFTYPRLEDLGSSLTVGPDRLEARAMQGSGAGRTSGRVVVVPNFGRTADYAGLDVKGAIALVRRGETRFGEKVRNAVQAGAAAVGIVNTAPGDLSGAIGEDVSVPVVGLPGSSGLPLLERAMKDRLEGTLEVNQRRTMVSARNLIARLEEARKPKLIVGGHVDTVAVSPGANDNGSGTASTLEVARRLAGTPAAKQIWFVGFDGHEEFQQPVLGSKHFVGTVTRDVLNDLTAMLNLDMIGVGERLMIGGTPGIVTMARAAAPTLEVMEDGLSDHTNFQQAGVPGLFFWRGMEPNYHQPTDRVINPPLLEDNVRQTLAVIARLLESDAK
jgi:Iap family predicted aminopeptidase